MKLNRLPLTSTSILFLIMGIQSAATAQTKLSSCQEIKQNEDFLALADKRAEIIAESQQLTADISELENELPEAITEADLERLKTQLSDLEGKPARTPLEEQTMQNLESKVKLAKTDKSINDAIAEKRRTLAVDKDLLLCLHETISQLSSPDQQFRKIMSGAFAALIALVIIGFFVLASIDEVMRRAIFSGETGIQFLTLFSLVIAIILFGITNILEDKELAALLGGLSGYILGRTGRKSDEVVAPPASTGGVAAFRKFIKDLKSIDVVPPSVSLSDTSKAQQLVAEPKDINGAVIKDDDKIFVPEWESSNPEVAKVDQAGLVSKVGIGTANVTATFGNVESSTCEITCT